jgi:hypothetical protein
MTRTAIGGIAAGAFTLGILAGLVVPGTLASTRHDQLMADHIARPRSMPMMATGSMPMMGTGSMSMMGTGSMSAGYGMHMTMPEVGR